MLPPPRVIIVMGVAGSGKSTIGRLLAAELGWHFHDADDDHSPENVAAMHRGIPLTDAQRQPWVRTLQSRIEQWLAADQPAVLACSALTEAIRRTLRGDNEQVCFVYLRGSRELVHRRIAQRKHFMPPSLLDSQFETLEVPHDAVVVDVADNPRSLVQQIRQQCGV